MALPRQPPMSAAAYFFFFFLSFFFFRFFRSSEELKKRAEETAHARDGIRSPPTVSWTTSGQAGLTSGIQRSAQGIRSCTTLRGIRRPANDRTAPRVAVMHVDV